MSYFKSAIEPTIYLTNGSMKGYIVQIAARYAGKNLRIQNHTIHSQHKGSVIYQDENINLNDGNAIAFYLANDQFKGNNILSQSQILQWISISDNYILPSVCGWVLPLIEISLIKRSEDSIKEAKSNLLEIMEVLDKVLSNKSFLVEEYITLADITVFVTLIPAYEYVFNLEIRKTYHNVDKWFEIILNQLQVKSIIKDFKYIFLK